MKGKEGEKKEERRGEREREREKKGRRSKTASSKTSFSMYLTGPHKPAVLRYPAPN